MNLLHRFTERYRTGGDGPYVCTLCGATFDDAAVVICPKCRGLVRRRTT